MKNGVILAIVSSLVFSIMNALVKAVSLSIPTAEVVFFRSIIGTVIIFFMMRHANVAFSTEGIPMLALRGVLGALYLITYFYTIAAIPLTDASILAHLAPFFVMMLAAVFLKEKPSKKTLALFPVAFLGAMLLVKPFQFSSYSVHALVGVLSAGFAAGGGHLHTLLEPKTPCVRNRVLLPGDRHGGIDSAHVEQRGDPVAAGVLLPGVHRGCFPDRPIVSHQSLHA
jgi:drug/metabolite transporter (DMT)-like permease